MSALVIRSRRHIEPRDPRRRNGPVVSVRPAPEVWQAAVREAGGDVSRLQVQPDGSVIVCNRQPRARLAAFPATVALVLALTACGDDEPDLGACEAAMAEQFAEAMGDPNAPEATRPPECEGVSDEDLERIAYKIMEEATE